MAEPSTDDMLRRHIKPPDMPVISLFTGCGGMEIGLEMAGFRTAACVEIDEDCRKTVALNRDWAFVLGEEGRTEEEWGKEYLLENRSKVVGLAAASGGRPEGPSVLLDDGRAVELSESVRLRKRSGKWIVEAVASEAGYVRSKDRRRLRHPCGRVTELDSGHRLRPAPLGDIRRLSTADILAVAGLRTEEAALVTGGAPCQPFSTIGEGLGVLSDKGNLFREFMRVVAEARPMGFVFENVSGLGLKQHRQVIEFIERASEDIGYGVKAGILNAADYGVPQVRKRLILLGARRDRCGAPAFPHPTHAKDPAAAAAKYAAMGLDVPPLRKWATVGDCLGPIRESEYGRPDSMRMGVSELMARRIRCIRVGTQDNFRRIPNDLRPECWRDRVDEEGRQLGYRGEDPFGRLSWDRPSVTIRTRSYHPMTGRFLHPTEPRALDTLEMARLQGFPAEWRFHGGLESVGRQIGNAVPPPLAAALGVAFRQL